MYLLLENNSNNNFKDESEIYQELIQKISLYIKEKDILEKIHRAYLLAKEKHKNQKRVTGEEFIIHPIHVSKILADLKSEPNTLISALLHDILEDTDFTFEELTKIFGEDVSYIVLKATKLKKLVFNHHQRQLENQQKMFLAMSKDIRVVLLKIADRLHNMQTLQKMRFEKQKRISKETLGIYVPLAHRLGLYRIKSQLEDLAFRYLNPKLYYKISNLIKIKKFERERSIVNIIGNMKKLFHDCNINNFDIDGRIKNIFSIYKKMEKKRLLFDEIFDLLAIRIIVDKVDSCYRCLGIIHNNYSPLPLKFKDYIAVPKPNLYQSLHSTVLSKDGTLFEIQIRTKEMNEIAENGIAAHWGYKENKKYSKEDKQLEIVKKLRWYQELIKITKDSDSNLYKNSKYFIDVIKNDILNENVYVFTPKQEVYEFPKGSTPIDFAFRIHSDIGYRISGAIVNNKIVPLNYILQNGDIVSIRTNKNIFRVKKEWLKIVKTIYTKKLIKKGLNKQKKNNLILVQMGKEILEKELNKHKIEFTIDKYFISQSFSQKDIQNIDEFYLSLANKKISSNLVIFKIRSFLENKKNLLNKSIYKNIEQKYNNDDTGVFIEEVRNVKLKIANCCLPVFDEEIVGFISKGKGISIHIKNCPNLLKYDSSKIVSAYWRNNPKLKYFVWINLICSSNHSLLTEIYNKMNFLGISFNKINISNNNNTKQTNIKLKICAKNIKEIEKLISNLSQLDNIYQIYRGIN
ncbi:MAG: RelA/SpoT family protein [Candidatus Phytoplasma stylosanthis]|uniref:RelA/SpoT family protein n=1 Tax=Candidatus Phytoplasma stylosanthis TaxID=2798314 RepID=UPI00293A63B5|nr:RelA/SpoT family protein [Candidatus Phytoplasma stylosanthis]MDV3170764.1 RelA/SpoT family protein [Candidatus Phytoplasma stylosanthis]MDV3173753.1 RelA/SpoT family protein [Candidatus Phytoplasma stylosanthis]MDV3174022.1 RelA/SpoT family protein [Candidatus Phytoplasma stylosanthis]